MMRRFALTFVFALLLSLTLGACGDTKNKILEDVPQYTNSTAVEFPDTFKTQLDASLKSIKDKSYEAYKTAESTTKIKDFFVESFKKSGWDDKSDKFEPETKQLMTQLQTFAIMYQKGTKIATVMSLSGNEAAQLGFQEVSPTDTLYLLVVGER
ncbi:MAG: hypothetical protein HXX08_05555 [Chloroflexi bacterium]|uniref:Uncharacterized protein n=1 Tax=Candidatus Chlorohelix allophototropha TaxID=3003348 RepID=A0A8T7LTG8_9CHLR|nr:hypothetical protein [Chloroflexota bacterium]WJW67202.1 hypothetical protein OZ401_000459 [Chloroflexota bacterium L227-S17]